MANQVPCDSIGIKNGGESRRSTDAKSQPLESEVPERELGLRRGAGHRGKTISPSPSPSPRSTSTLEECRVERPMVVTNTLSVENADLISEHGTASRRRTRGSARILLAREAWTSNMISSPYTPHTPPYAKIFFIKIKI